MKKILTILSILLLTAACTTPKVEYYEFAPEVADSELYSVSVEGRDIKVFPTYEAHFSWFGVQEEYTVKLEVDYKGGEINDYVVRPVAKGHETYMEDGKIVVMLKKYDRISVEINGDISNPLFIFANPVDKQKPSKNDPSVRYYEAGKVYEEGDIILSEDCKEVYFEPGTLVKGNIYANGLTGVRIHGGGFLNSQEYTGRAPKEYTPSLYQPYSIALVNCPEADLDDYTHLFAHGGWCSLYTNCDNSVITNVKSLSIEVEPGKLTNNDSMDIIGGKNVRVEHCFLCGHDDVYCLKSQKFWLKGDVDGIYYEDCIGWNIYSGNTFEIGYETNIDIKNVHYKDIYAIHSGTGKNGLEYRRSALSIHNGAGGTISNVTYTNAYIEDAQENVLYLAILEHDYNFGFDDEGNKLKWHPGRIDGVTYNNINVLAVREGRGKAVIEGYDEQHKVSNVTFNGFKYLDREIESLEDSIFVVKKDYSDFKFN